MTQRSFPWDGDTTGDAGPYSGSFERLFYGRQYQNALFSNNRAYGFLPGSGPAGSIPFFVEANSPENLSVIVNQGAGVYGGALFDNDAQLALTISENVSGSTRQDFIVIERDDSAQTVRLKVVEGTPGAGAPSLTQTVSFYEFPIALVTINSGDSTISNADIDLDGYNEPIQAMAGSVKEVSNNTDASAAINAWTASEKLVNPIIAATWANKKTVYFSVDGGDNFVAAWNYTKLESTQGPTNVSFNSSAAIGTQISFTAEKDHFFIAQRVNTVRNNSHDGDILVTTTLSINSTTVSLTRLPIRYAGANPANFATADYFGITGRFAVNEGDSVTIDSNLELLGGNTGDVDGTVINRIYY